jgi:hypothetical protein
LEGIAQIEISSEESSHPVEGALLQGSETGWRAAHPGAQILRLIFDKPLRIRRIRLVFVEAEITRSQEFVLRWSPDSGRSFREIVRQQWNFSPPETTVEAETYRVDLADVTMLELVIVPDRSGGEACASLEQLRLGVASSPENMPDEKAANISLGR